MFFIINEHLLITHFVSLFLFLYYLFILFSTFCFTNSFATYGCCRPCLLFLKLFLGIAARTPSHAPWIGLKDQKGEGFFQWSDGSAGEVYT